MLAATYFLLRGIPFIYQGQEIGMTNCVRNDISEYDDISTKDQYLAALNAGCSKEAALHACYENSRDNARTPMQWDDSAYAGFSTANPWIMVNPNYTKINAKDQVNREDSVFKYYQKLIKLRHESELIVYGTYDLILDDDKDIYAYIRTLGDEKLIVYCNFSENTREVELPEEFTNGKVLISNYIDAKVNHKITLRPYEAIVIQK